MRKRKVQVQVSGQTVKLRRYDGKVIEITISQDIAVVQPGEKIEEEEKEDEV